MNKKLKKVLHKAGAMTMALILGSSGVVQGAMSVYAATSLSGAYAIKDDERTWRDTDYDGTNYKHMFSSYEPGTKSIQVNADYAHRIETTKKTKYTVTGKRVGIGKTVGPTGEDKDTMTDTESKPLFRVSENTAGSMAVKISDCEIWQCDADGSNAHKVKVDVLKTITNFKQNAEGDIDGQKDGYIHFSTGLNGVSYMDNVEEVTMKTEFYKAGTNEKVSLKSNITLSDIDNSQYVSVNSKIMSGEYVASATNLLYNKDGNYDVYSSKTGNDTSGVKSAVGFIFETNTFMYTFGKDVKQPTGNVQYVASSSQSMVSFQPTKPIKTVSDVDKDSTAETDVTTNHLPDLAKSWLYKVTQPIVTNTAEKDYYDSFVMSDTLDSCLTLDKTPVVENQEGSDVSNLFNIKVEGTKVTATAKNTKDKGFYENSSYVLKIQAKVAGVKAGMSEEENKALIEKLKAHGHYNETQTTLHYENKEETIIDGEVYPSNKVDTIIELPKPNEDGKEPGLKITKDVNRYEHQVNDIVKYTVTVKNANPKADTAYFVIKDTTLPDTMALDFSSVKVSGIDAKDYTLTQSGNGWILASKGDYALPQSATIKITYDAKALVASNGTCVDNTASTYAAGIPTKEDKEQVYINSPKVDVVKEAPDRNYKVGDTVGYKVTITNRNAGTFMRDIVMNDLVQTKGLEIKEGTVAVLVNGKNVTKDLDVVYQDDGTGFTIKTPYNLKNGTIPCLSVSPYDKIINWVDKVVVTYDATITNDAALETDLKNIFDVPSTKNTNDELIREDDTIPSGGGSSEEDVKMKAPALDIEKKSNKQEYKVGDIGKYTLTVKQTKEETTAKNVVVKDAFVQKDGLEINKDSLVVKMNGEDITKDCEIKADATSFTIATGKNMTDEDKLEITYDVTFKQAGEYTNTAVASSDNTNEDKSTNVVEVKETEPELVIDKKSDKTTYAVGETGIYTLVVNQTNKEATAKNVIIQDKFATAQGIAIDKDSLVVKLNGEDITKDCDITANAADFYIATKKDMTSKDEIIVSYAAVFSKTGTYKNTAVTQADNANPKQDNNTVEVKNSDFNIVKDADKKEYAVGDTVNYKVTLSLKKEGSASKNVVITDTIPEGLELQAESVKVTGLDAKDYTTTVKGNALKVMIPQLKYGQTVVVTYQAKVLKAAVGKKLTNKADVNGEGVNPGSAAVTVKVPKTSPKAGTSSGGGVPKTGDSNHMVWFLGAMIAATLGIVIIARKKLKKQKK